MTTARTRSRRVEDTIRSAEIEGLGVTPETRADADSYVAGIIDSDELVDRVRARYGLS
ncbi:MULTISPECIES: antitoxin VbhA family protein [unclassified Microbacterium]|uniref:antitoxin VbhA family protein n=1 Tax=unclassified Microbacterium TaxID=2609290 RepID=UPI001443B640|nr:MULTISPECIES: antitoxin VbhA family protein [unclassified Microbacterium]